MEKSNHPGGNNGFWQDEEVKRYNYKQNILNEGKEEALAGFSGTCGRLVYSWV